VGVQSNFEIFAKLCQNIQNFQFYYDTVFSSKVLIDKVFSKVPTSLLAIFQLSNIKYPGIIIRKENLILAAEMLCRHSTLRRTKNVVGGGRVEKAGDGWYICIT
jgi:hypothetical protein